MPGTSRTSAACFRDSTWKRSRLRLAVDRRENGSQLSGFKSLTPSQPSARHAGPHFIERKFGTTPYWLRRNRSHGDDHASGLEGWQDDDAHHKRNRRERCGLRQHAGVQEEGELRVHGTVAQGRGAPRTLRRPRRAATCRYRERHQYAVGITTSGPTPTVPASCQRLVTAGR